MVSNWLQQHEALIGTMLAASAFFWVGTLIVVPLVLIRLPADYLTRKKSAFAEKQFSPVFQYPYLVGKNLLGALFILAGLAMLILPGQGLLTLALGIGLISFPGKHRVLQRILGQRRVLKAINRLRVRAKKPPLAVPQGKGLKNVHR